VSGMLRYIQIVEDIVRLSIKALSERKLRAALTITGVAIGPLIMVMMSSVVAGYSDYIVGQIEGLGQNLIVVSPRSGRTLTQNDLDKIRALEGVKQAEPFYATQGSVKVGGKDRTITVFATGIDLVLSAISGLKIEDGSEPSPNDVVGALVGYNIAFDDSGNQVYRVGDVITLTVYVPGKQGATIRRINVVIRGILGKFGGAFFLSPDTSVFLTTEAGRRLLGINDWSGILVLAESTDLVPKLTKDLEDMYTGSADVVSFQGIANIARSIIGAVQFIQYTTSLSAFVVAIAGIAATMITSVLERIREIAVMKAVGFTDATVLVLILMESVVMSLIGGAIGMSIGVLGAFALASQGFVIRGMTMGIAIVAQPKITAGLIGQTVGLTVLTGILGGIFPAYRAMKIPPALALRYE